jgi:nucleoside-diphosphate-sugar epimerase
MDEARAVDGPVLITGVNGFIGGHLARRLVAQGVRVRGLDVTPARQERVEHMQVDLTEPRSLSRAVDGCRVVFHCARWNGRPRSWDAARVVDVHGTANVLEACRCVGVARVVHISSIVVYGPTRVPVIAEETRRWPVGLYGACKVEADECAEIAARRGLPVVTLRPGQVYGPGAAGGTVGPMRWLAAGRPALADGGSGLIHPLYVDNLVDALLAAASTPGVEGQAFNVADGNVPWRVFYGHYARMCGRPLRSVPSSLLWMAGIASEAAGRITGRPPDFDRASVVYLTRRSAYSTEKARSALGWSPRRTMVEAMDVTERWLRDTGVLRT